MQSEIRET